MPTRAQQPGFRRIAVVLFGSALLLILLFGLSLRLPLPPAPTRSARPVASLSLTRLDRASSDPLLREEAFLHDPTPLFLPTEWNASQDVRPEEAFHEPGDVFRRFPAKPSFGEKSLDLLLPPAVEVPARPADELALTPWDRPFIGFGRTKLQPAQLPPRSAELELSSAEQGRRSFRMTLQGLTLPGDAQWQPAEFLMECDAAGPIGEPALIHSSGVEVIDRLLQKSLVADWPALASRGRLSRGLYHVTIGP